MSRLTKYCIDGYIARNFDYDSLSEMSAGDCEVFNDVVDKLGRYETLEDKGRLMELPCAEGDEVFIIWGPRYRAGRTVYGINTAKFRLSDIPNLNKTVFVTKEAAEAKLAEMEGMNE